MKNRVDSDTPYVQDTTPAQYIDDMFKETKMRKKRLPNHSLLNLLLVSSVFLLLKPAFAYECPNSQERPMYIGVYTTGLFATPEAACAAAILPPHYAGFYYAYTIDLGNERSYRCAYTPDGVSFTSPWAIGPQCEPIIHTPPDKDDGPSNCTGNPCNVATGNKYQSETDFTNNEITYTRIYNSRKMADLGLGIGWRSNHQKQLLVSENIYTLTQVSGTGRGETWVKALGVWQGDADSDILLSEDASGFQLTKTNGTIENYDLTGKIISEMEPNGNLSSYTYNVSDQLVQVSTQYGHSISFTYTSGNVATVTDTFGSIYTYEYDVNNNLETVIFPDTTPSDSLDNPRKMYHYENANFPNHLTGITDENGNRFATYAYGANGKAISTEHAQTSGGVGQEKFQLDFQGE